MFFFSLFLFVFLFSPLAQPCNEDNSMWEKQKDKDKDKDKKAPLDGGVVILMSIGLVYGIYIRKKNLKN